MLNPVYWGSVYSHSGDRIPLPIVSTGYIYGSRGGGEEFFDLNWNFYDPIRTPNFVIKPCSKLEVRRSTMTPFIWFKLGPKLTFGVNSWSTLKFLWSDLYIDFCKWMGSCVCVSHFLKGHRSTMVWPIRFKLDTRFIHEVNSRSTLKFLKSDWVIGSYDRARLSVCHVF